MGKIVKNEPCPQCRDQGRDRTGDHLMRFKDGGGYCKRCGYTEKGDKVSKTTKYRKSYKDLNNDLDISDIIQFGAVNLKDRKLPKSVLKKYNTYIECSEVTGEPKKAYFGYNRDGKVSSFKVRRLDQKEFLPSVGSLKNCDMFGSHLWQGKSSLILTEGECLMPDCEVLTPRGWVSIEDYDPDKDLVGQVSEGNGLEFVRPLAKVWKHYKGIIINYESGSYKMCVTEGHKMVRQHKQKGWIRTGTKNHLNLPIPRVFKTTSPGIGLLDLEIQLQVMLSADFTFRKEGDIYGAFSKKRKIDRAKKLLDMSGLKYSSKLEKSGCTNFYIHRGQDTGKFSKLFNMEWLGRLSSFQCNSILREVLLWDGNEVPGRNQIEYSSKYLHNAKFIQTVAHMAGYVSTIIPRRNDLGSWYKVSILFGKTSSSTQNGCSETEYKGMVGCVQVPSGMIAVRYKGSISITGNCDAMAVYYMLSHYFDKRGYNTVPNVGSVQNGADGAASEIAKNWSKLKKFKTIYLYFDSDKAGEKALRKVANAIPSADLERIRVIKVPGFNDANDCLKGGKKGFNKLIDAYFNAQPYRPSEVVAGSDITLNSLMTPLQKGLDLPWPGINAKYRGQRQGELWIVTGPPGGGKTTLIRCLHYHNLMEYKKKVMGIYLEDGRPSPEHPMKAAQSLIALHNGISLPMLRINPKKLSKKKWESSYKEVIDNGRAHFVDHFGGMSIDELMELLMYAHAVIKAEVVILDHISMLFSGQKSTETGSERKDIDLLMTELAKFCAKTNVTIFAISHISKGAESKDAKGNRFIRIQSLDDLRGSSSIGQLSWNVLALNNSGNNRVTPLALKNREWGSCGECPDLMYNEKTGWLVEVEEDED